MALAEVSFRPTVGMLMRSYYAVNWRRMLILAVVAVAWMAYALQVSQDRAGVAFIFQTMCIAVGTLMLLIWIVLPWRRYVSLLKSPVFSGDWNIVLDEESMIFRNEHSETKYDWVAVTALIEKPDLLIMRFGKLGMMVIPESAAGGRDGLLRIRDLIRQKIAGAKGQAGDS